MLPEPGQKVSTCRLQDAEANVILEALKAFWDAEEKASDARGSATKIPSEAKPVCPSEPSADSSASAKEQPSRAAAEADGKQKAAEDVELSRQGKGRTADLAADVAADVDEGASSMKPHTQGSCSVPLISAYRISALSSSICDKSSSSAFFIADTSVVQCIW